ncbi:MAG: hypothetical protein LBD23_18260, partial [Oscillospiraceae bacterium]|nr:hypothetical protein [Oscillospiraceae bacterium]
MIIKLINIVLVGCNGYMGRVVTALVAENPSFSIIAGIDIITQEQSGYPVFANPDKLNTGHNEIIKAANVVIDFSNPSAIDSLLNLGISKSLPLILCATGYSPENIADIEN